MRLVDELQWLGGIILGGDRAGERRPDATAADGARTRSLTRPPTCSRRSWRSSSTPPPAPTGCARAQDALRRSTRALPERVSLPHAERVAACHTQPDQPTVVDAEASAFASALDPAFRAQEASFMAGQIAANVRVIVAADARSWWERLLGRQPPGIGGPISSLRERAGAHLGMRSVAARNALRAGVALAIAVLASRLLDVEHAFWVSFGTLSILRSNALSTGQTFVRALGGTVLGFVLGALLVLAIGTNATLLWALLPVAVVIAGVAPAAISFLAGQAAFTVVLFILFNILAPAGWRIGLVRVEDVALGGATSLVVGLLFWPRGAAAAFARALADAYAESTHYLTTAIAQAVICCAPGMVSNPTPPTPPEARGGRGRLSPARRHLPHVPGRAGSQAARAGGDLDARDRPLGAAARRRCGDRPVVGRRGRRPRAASWPRGSCSTAPVTSRTGMGGSAPAWSRSPPTEAAAGRPWPTEAAAAARAAGARIRDAERRLLATIDGDLRSPDGSATVTAVRIAWTGAFLDAARRLEPMLVADGARGGRAGHARAGHRSGRAGARPAARRWAAGGRRTPPRPAGD